MKAFLQYTNELASARESVSRHPALRRLMGNEVSDQALHRFLIEYCALGVQITEPVDGWIRRAGARCKELGYEEVGDNLMRHAEHEAGHHLLFIDDVHRLVAQYNQTFGENLNAGKLLAQSATPKMREYIDLHERNIGGSTPYCQVAIELEIEGLSVSVGPKLIAQLEARLGKEVVASLSFLNEHVALDIGHTALNNKMLERLLDAHPETLGALVRTGQGALAVYLDFFGECLARSEQSLERKTVPATASAS